MSVTEAIVTLVDGGELPQRDAEALFAAIMAGEATSAQIAAVLVALKCKGESVAEIAGAALAMRAAATKVAVTAPRLVDTCGTGGSGAAKRFNISTAAAFVAAAAGAAVAKHGNRAMSGKSGSADILEAAGAELALSPPQVARCIREVGVGFLFAPRHHPAMRHAGPVRRELGVGTVFNLLGPLTNPADAKRQLLGVSAAGWQRPLAEVSAALGAEHVLVVHADGLDELSIAGPSRIVEATAGRIESYEVAPSDFDLREQPMDALRADSPEHSRTLVDGALDGSLEAARDIVALNAGAALYAAGAATTVQRGVGLAQEVIASGRAKEKLAEFVALTRALAGRDPERDPE